MNEPEHDAPLPAELPPVKPPTGAFILQLFLVPSLIVAALFLVVGMFGMLAGSGGDPQQYVQGLLHENAQRRWRAAHALANMLTADTQAPLKLSRRLASDRPLAVSLTDTLRRILDGETQVGGSDSDEDTLLRAYLATALGMFDEPVGVPVLLQATRDKQTEVRLRALESIARLAANPDQPDQPRDLGDPNVVPELIDLAEDEQPVVRKMCAYAMGIIGDERFVGDAPESPGALLRLLRDANGDVSYNAAGALARMGREEALPVLLRMLTADPARPEILQEPMQQQQEAKTETVLVGALESIMRLAERNPKADLSEVPALLVAYRGDTGPDDDGHSHRMQLDARGNAQTESAAGHTHRVTGFHIHEADGHSHPEFDKQKLVQLVAHRLVRVRMLANRVQQITVARGKPTERE